MSDEDDKAQPIRLPVPTLNRSTWGVLSLILLIAWFVVFGGWVRAEFAYHASVVVLSAAAGFEPKEPPK